MEEFKVERDHVGAEGVPPSWQVHFSAQEPDPSRM